MSIMKLKIYILLAFICACPKVIFGQEWLGRIIPVETNIRDIEKIFKIEPEKRISSLFYKLKEGNLILDYSQGACTQTSIGKFDVEKGTVINFIFYPKIHPRLSYYKVDIKKMKKSGDDTDAKIYFDDRKGVAYSIYAGKVHSIEYYPAKKYGFLECQE